MSASARYDYPQYGYYFYSLSDLDFKIPGQSSIEKRHEAFFRRVVQFCASYLVHLATEKDSKFQKYYNRGVIGVLIAMSTLQTIVTALESTIYVRSKGGIFSSEGRQHFLEIILDDLATGGAHVAGSEAGTWSREKLKPYVGRLKAYLRQKLKRGTSTTRESQRSEELSLSKRDSAALSEVTL